MRRFTVEVIEKRFYTVLYEVEAESIEEAIEKAGIGETVMEHDEVLSECGDRDVIEDTVEEMYDEPAGGVPATADSHDFDPQCECLTCRANRY